MKIVQLITGSAAFGGAEAHVRDLTFGLRGRGHDCIVMTGSAEGLLSEQLRAKRVPVVVVPALQKPMHAVWDTVSLMQVVSALRDLRPDLLATHTAKAGFVGRAAAKLTGTPCFFTPHGVSFINRRTGRHIKFRLALEQLAARSGATIIAVSEAEKRIAVEHLRLQEGQIATIHNGLPDYIPHRRLDRSRLCITMVARFEEQKDHATLLQALSTLAHLDWELKLAGTGPLLSAAKWMAEQRGIASRVHFLNECSNIPHLLAETDIFTLVTNWESFPISILEAMRSGLPIVATDTGGICEAIDDGVNGFLVPRADALILAERLSRLIISAELRMRMGSQSREQFLKRFEMRLMLDKTEAMYAAAVKRQPLAAVANAISA
jgi:glycosyltransferase involved in cell wall biosynthesis